MIANKKAIGYHFVNIIYYILFCITLAVNITEKPCFVTSITMLVLLLIHDEVYNKWQQSTRVEVCGF
jgi:hypothetical protein